MRQFSDIPKEYTLYEHAEIVILPIPYDGTSTWVKGADKGPVALVEATDNLEWYDIETKSEVYKKGIYVASPVFALSTPDEMVAETYKRVSDYLKKDKTVISVGGEHSVSLGAIKAYSEKFDDFSVLQLDAHTDLRPEYHGSKYNHACVMYHVQNICPIVQVGIRSLDKAELEYVNSDRIFFADDIHGNDSWMQNASNQLKKNVYITIDLDVFDPSIMPSTGTPEPGGMLWYDVIKFLRKVSQEHTIVGFDIVELCPNENNKAPNYLAAKLLYKLLSYKYF